MPVEQFTNLVSCTLASDLTAVATTIALKSGDGAQLPAIASATDQAFRLVLTDKSGNTEIISICRREAGSDTLYVGTGTSHQSTGNVAGRGMEGTTALAVTATDDHIIEMGWTAAQAEAALEYTTLGKLTDAGAALLDDADADAQLTTLGGTAAGTALFKAATAAAQVTALGFTASAAEINGACDGSTAKNSHTHDYRGCIAYKTTSQTPSSGWNAVTFASEVVDTSSMHSTSTNTSRFTIPASGVEYVRIFAYVCRVGNASSGSSDLLALRKNGSDYLYYSDRFDDAVNAYKAFSTPAIAVSGSDYLELMYYDCGDHAGIYGDSSNVYQQTRIEIEILQ